MTDEEKRNNIKRRISAFPRIPYARQLAERALYPFDELNKLTGGMELGEISVIAGETGAGKTTFVSQCVAHMIRDEKVLCVYGESTVEKQAQAMYRQMTPNNGSSYQYVKYYKNGKATNIGQYFVSESAEKVVKEKTRDKLYYYDTRCGMSMPRILETFQVAHEDGGINYFLVDNIMQIETATENEVKEIKDSIESLRRFVIDNKVHCILVAHYRKAQDYSVSLRRRLEEVCGTSAIGNKAATAINVIRLTSANEGSKGYKTLGEVLAYNNYDIRKADGVIEVLKTRFSHPGFVAYSYDHTTNTYHELPKEEVDLHRKLPERKEEKRPILYGKTELLEVDPADQLPF